jgi:hypothetical protein
MATFLYLQQCKLHLGHDGRTRRSDRKVMVYSGDGSCH